MASVPIEAGSGCGELLVQRRSGRTNQWKSTDRPVWLEVTVDPLPVAGDGSCGLPNCLPVTL